MRRVTRVVESVCARDRVDEEESGDATRGRTEIQKRKRVG